MKTCDPDRLADLQRAMQLIVDAVAQLPDGRRDVSGSAAPPPAASSPAWPSCWSAASSRR